MLSRKRKGIQSARSIKKKRNRLILTAALFFVAAAALVTALSFLSGARFVQVQKINVTSSSDAVLVSPSDEIQAVAEGDLAGSWWHLFSKKNSFLFPGAKIVADIIAAFPRVQSVRIEHEGWTQWNTLNIIVTERAPFALACDAAEQCFYMDSTGFIYAPAPQFSSGVYVRYYASSSLATSTPVHAVAVGSTLAGQDRVDVAQQAVDFISQMGIQVTRATILPNNEYTLAIKNNYATSTPPGVDATSTATMTPVSIIYFNDSTPIDKMLGYFLAFWQHSTNKNFNYIDLRYGNDIVFKMNEF